MLTRVDCGDTATGCTSPSSIGSSGAVLKRSNRGWVGAEYGPELFILSSLAARLTVINPRVRAGADLVYSYKVNVVAVALRAYPCVLKYAYAVL